ncbi:MAG: hypothetical protein ABII89_07710 [Candidatus Omnitrophota bacterium]
MKKLLIILVLTLVVTGCGKLKEVTAREPTANACKKVLENSLKGLWQGYYSGQERLQVLSAEKIQAYEKTENGTPVCYVTTRFKIKYLISLDDTVHDPYGLYTNLTFIGNTLSNIAHDQVDCPEGKKGEIKSIVFKVRFEKTNKGWLGCDGNFY